MEQAYPAGAVATVSLKLPPVAAAKPELPRSVRKGPPITVTCECGQRRDLRYGARWECEGCGRTYDTNRIPVQEYAGIRARQRRQAVLPLTVALIVAALAAYLVASGRAVGAIVIVPLAGLVWGQVVRPARSRRLRRQLAELPRWDIEAE